MTFRTATSASSNSNAPAWTIPASAQTGDVVLLELAIAAGSTLLTGAPSGTSQVGSLAPSGGLSTWLYTYTVKSTDTPGTTALTWTLSAGRQWRVVGYVASGVTAPSAANVLTRSSAASSVNVVMPAGSAPVAGSVIEFGSFFTTTTAETALSPPSGWTLRANTPYGTTTGFSWVSDTAGQVASGAGVGGETYTSDQPATAQATYVVVLADASSSSSFRADFTGFGSLSVPPLTTPLNRVALGQLGDSLTYQNSGAGISAMTSAYVGDGWQSASVKVDGLVGRFVFNATPAPSSSDVIDAWAAAGFNPYDIVVALGTNDVLSANSSFWSAAVDNLLNKISSTLPGAHRLWWVNLAGDPTVGADGAVGTHGNTIASYNAFLAAKLAGTGVTVLDWNAKVKADLQSMTYWLNDANHVHMTAAGYAQRNAWLAAQLAPSAPFVAAFTGSGALAVGFATSAFSTAAAFTGSGDLAATVKASVGVAAAFAAAGQLGAVVSVASTVPWPQVAVEVCFNVDPFDPDPPAEVWTDITDRVTALTYGRGRQYERDQVEAGSPKFTVRNADGALDPENTSSPFWPNVRLLRQIRVRATWRGVTRSLFTGFVERWPQRWESAGVEQWTDIEAVDALSPLSNDDLPSAYVAEVLADDPAYFYPLDDQTDATAAAEGSGAGTFATLASSKYGDGEVTFGADGGFIDGATAVTFTQPNPGDLSHTGMTVLSVPDLTPTGATLTVEAWVNVPTPPASDGIVWIAASPTRQNGLVATGGHAYLAVQHDGTALWVIGGEDWSVASVASVCDGRWHHLVATLGTGVPAMRLYVDGVLDNQRNVITGDGTELLGPVSTQLGGYIDPAVRSSASALNGSLARLAVYPVELAADRVETHYRAGADGFAGELSGARVTRLLRYAGWTGPSTIAAGASAMGPLADLAGKSATQALQDTATAESGLLFIDGTGAIVFADRHSRYNAPAAWSFGETALPYSDIATSYDETHIANAVSVTRTGGVTSRASDPVSDRRYGTRTLDVELAIASDAETVDAARYLLGRYAEPATRLDSVTIDAAGNPELWPAVLGIDVDTRIDVTRKPTWSDDPLVFPVWVEALRVDIARTRDDTHWKATYSCSPADVNTYLVWGGAGPAGEWDNAKWSY